MTNVVDPLGGSYYVERLTNEMEAAARAYIEKIDALGGMLQAVEVGFPQREIAEAAYKFQQEVDAKEQSIVGVNVHADEGEQEIPTLKIDLSAEQKQIDRIRAFRAKRDPKRYEAARTALLAACREGRNVMPVLIDGVDAGLTLGEVSDVYREVFGVYTDPGLI